MQHYKVAVNGVSLIAMLSGVESYRIGSLLHLSAKEEIERD